MTVLYEPFNFAESSDGGTVAFVARRYELDPAMVAAIIMQESGAGGGMIYQSGDGITFSQTEIRAYEPVDHYIKRWPDPVKAWGAWALQRPALLLDKNGMPTHLFAPCGTPPQGAKGTATFLFEINLK